MTATDLQPIQKAVLSILSSTGRYMRLKRLGGAPKGVVLGLVLSGYARRDDKHRYRITGKGLEALEGKWLPMRLDPKQHTEGADCRCHPRVCGCVVGYMHSGPLLPHVGALGECDTCGVTVSLFYC